MTTWNTADDLVTFAEESTSPPPLPPGGIPRQRIPGWIRWPIRAVIMPFVTLDIWAQRIARLFFKTPYKQEGGCLQRGNCCYFIFFPEPSDWLSKLFYYWNIEINGFYPRDSKPMQIGEDNFRVMGCRYLGEDGRCGNYRLRPAICRTWPKIEYFGRPKVLKGCGFKAVPRDKNFDPFPQEEPPINTNKLKILK